jgi:hypothetical protein
MTGPAALTRRALLPYAGLAAAAVAAPGMAAGSAGAPSPLSARDVWLPAGTHRVEANTTVKGDLTLAPGARIEIAAGRTLTVLGQFSAPVAPVLGGGGTLDLNAGRTPAAWPEWWGALANDGDADCLPALRACLAAHPVMMLRAADYYIADTLVVERPFARIWGAGYRGSRAGQGTRLLVKSGSADVLRVGGTAPPANVNSFLQGVDLRWMDLSRTRPVEGEAAGLRIHYVLHCQFEGISSRESTIGFAVSAAVRTYLRDCIAFRSLPGKAAGTWRGFHLGGMESIGLAGANGSLFLHDCNTSIGGDPGVNDSVGVLLEGGFADTFIANMEVTSHATGIRIDGAAARMGARAISGHANLHIRLPIVDQCGLRGIEIRDTSEFALIDLSDAYVAVAPGAQAAIVLDNAHGAITIAGGQLIGRSDAARHQAVGLSARASTGLDVQGIKIADFGRPVVLDAVSATLLQGQIVNPLVEAKAPAVTLRGCQDVVLRCRVGGKAGAFADGVAFAESAPGAVLVETALIDAAALTGVRVRAGPRDASTPGRYGGLMVAG